MLFCNIGRWVCTMFCLNFFSQTLWIFLSVHELLPFSSVSYRKGSVILSLRANSWLHEQSKFFSSSLRNKYLYSFLWGAKPKFLIWTVFVTQQFLIWKKHQKHYNGFVYLQLIDLIMLKNKKRRLKKLLFSLL